MADVIKFKCKCGKKMAVRAEYAGKKARCPECKQAVRVPTPRPDRAASGSPVAAGSSSAAPSKPSEPAPPPAVDNSLFELAAMEQQATAEMAELTSKRGGRAGVTDVKGGKQCPDCNTAVKQEAVVCIHCGHNFGTGKRLKTKKDTKLSKAFAAMTEPADDDYVEDNHVPWWLFWVGAISIGMGVAIAFYDYNPNESDDPRLFDAIAGFFYDSIGQMPTAGVLWGIGAIAGAFWFKGLRG